MLRLFLIIKKLSRFPVLDLLVIGLSVALMLFKPYGALEQRQMLKYGVGTIAQVTKITETVFGTFVDYSFTSQDCVAVKGTIGQLDISGYGLTSVIPQTVAVSYLPEDLDFVWLGSIEGQIETFWTDFFKGRWIDVLFNYAIWTLMLRLIILNMKREIRRGLQDS